MKDEKGLYYYPKPGDTRARVYVRRGEDGEILFRLWQAGTPRMYDEHGWLPYDVIKLGAEYFCSINGPEDDPLWMYDINVARELLKDDEKKGGGKA